MFADVGLSGRSLPAGHLCLTFDDGPGASEAGRRRPGTGPRTLDLARYLAAQGVPATFFVVGKHVVERPDIVTHLRRLGHTVGNHTHRHANLVELHEIGGDLGAEVALADAVIGLRDSGRPTPFRPPYGAWSPKVSATLNREPLQAVRHVGPVLWDIDGRDWAAWRGGVPVERCAADYLRAIEAAGRGIVLMHDSTADSDLLRARNQTYAMVQILLPQLLALGFRFVPVHDVPDVAAAVTGTVVLRGSSVRNHQVVVGAPVTGLAGDAAPGAVGVRTGRRGLAVLVTNDGRHLVAEEGGGGRLAVSESAGTPFEPVPVGSRIAFRAPSGHFLTRCAGTELLSVTADALGPSETFACEAVPDGAWAVHALDGAPGGPP